MTIRQINLPHIGMMPREWIVCAFEQLLAEPVRNGMYKKKEFHGYGTKMVNMGELFAFDFLSSQDMRRIELTHEERSKYLLIDGDLLFARRSLILEGSGKCSIVVKPVEPMTFESSLIRARLDRAQADPRFYFHFFKSPIGRALIASIASQTAVSGIRGSDLAKLLVVRPPLPIQRRIAAILSAYDDLIDNNSRRIKILEEMAQMIYREWFVDFRFPGHENVKMVESELGLIPEGWLVGRIGDLCESRKDSYVDGKHGGLRLVDLARMRARTLSLGETGRPSELTTSRILFQEDDILFGSIRPYLHKVALAPLEGVTNVSVLVIRPYRPHLRALLAVMLGSEDVIRWADQYSTGTKMPVIKWDTLRAKPVALPQTEILLERFQECIGPMLEAIKRVFFRNLNLRCTRDLLMPRLISGEIDVENLDIDTGEAPA